MLGKQFEDAVSKYELSNRLGSSPVMVLTEEGEIFTIVGVEVEQHEDSGTSTVWLKAESF